MMESIHELFPSVPKYRMKQVQQALFQPQFSSWNDVSVLPKEMRGILMEKVPWITSVAVKVLESRNGDTYKAVLKTPDNLYFETVLMANAKGYWTICVSSQIGCAMGCTFCATGTMGLKRSLTAWEIADQYRYWMYFLKEKNTSIQRISNIVFMGMGEPLMNYEAVKEAITLWLANTDLGPTKITVSSVGVLPVLERILTDPLWPPVKIAISLHSATEERRKEIVPTTIPGFHKKLADWSLRYAQTLGNRRHHITYEYTLLNGVNDTEEHAHTLAKYILTTGFSKINLIPFNPVPGKDFSRSQGENIEVFKSVLLSYGINVTQRKTMGDNIAAACGQLVTLGVSNK